MKAVQRRNVELIELAMIQTLYPNFSVKERKTLHGLLKEKDIALFNVEQVYPVTDNVLGSIIRHNETNYEQLIAHTEKYKARAILGPVVSQRLALAKSGNAFLNLSIETGTPVKVVEDREPEIKSCVVIGHDPEYSNVNAMFKVKRLTKANLNSNSFIDLSGAEFGKFTVIGLSAHSKGRWVVRCECGEHEFRTAKAIKNPANAQDACAKCKGGK